jgi:hypothetical protein
MAIARITSQSSRAVAGPRCVAEPEAHLRAAGAGAESAAQSARARSGAPPDLLARVPVMEALLSMKAELELA